MSTSLILWNRFFCLSTGESGKAQRLRVPGRESAFTSLRSSVSEAIASFSRDELQDFLDRKAQKGLSYSVVSHLRWDLKQIFELAVSEGYLIRNPASMLFVPKEARRAPKLVMNLAGGEEDVLAVGAEGAADCEAGRS